METEQTPVVQEPEPTTATQEQWFRARECRPAATGDSDTRGARRPATYAGGDGQNESPAAQAAGIDDIEHRVT